MFFYLEIVESILYFNFLIWHLCFKNPLRNEIYNFYRDIKSFIIFSLIYFFVCLSTIFQFSSIQYGIETKLALENDYR